MNEMIERVARAILDESYRMSNSHSHRDFNALHPVLQGVFLSFAKAAIEAMPEPTDNVTREGNEASGHSNFGSAEGWKITITIDATLSE